MAYTMTQYGHPHWDGEWWEDGSVKRAPYNHANSISRQEYRDPHWNALSTYRPRPSEPDLIWNGTSIKRESTRTKWGVAEIMTPAWTYGWKYFTKVHDSTRGWWPLEGPAIVASEPIDPMNRLIGKFRAEVPNIANMLGEYRETADMFAHAGRQVLQSLWLARHGHIVAACEAIGIALAPLKRNGKKSVSNAYLQWHFGVSTMLGDLHQALLELQNETLNARPLITRQQVRQRVEENKTIEYPFGNFGGVISRNAISRWDKILIGYVEWNSNEVRLAADHGITNPVATAWELLWSSYIVDWIIDVGSWLTALDFPLLVERSICYEINRSFDVSTFKADSRCYGGNDVIILLNERTDRVERKFERTIRELKPRLPQWQPHASTTRALVTLALARQWKNSGAVSPPTRHQLWRQGRGPS